MSDKNIAKLALHGEEKLKTEIIDKLLQVEIAMSKLNNPRRGENYPIGMNFDIKNSIQAYNSVKKSLEECGVDVSVFEERLNQMKKEYNYTD
jgi:hypothetical protein